MCLCVFTHVLVQESSKQTVSAHVLLQTAHSEEEEEEEKEKGEGRNQKSAAHKHFIMIHCAAEVNAGWITSFLDRRREAGHWRWETYGNVQVACVLVADAFYTLNNIILLE